MRVTALLATYNEERFIENCLSHLISQGVDVYLLDNDSTDATVEIARDFLGRGVTRIEQLPRSGQYDWTVILRRKEALAATLMSDWFMHVDADEIRLPPAGHTTLLDAVRSIDEQGYNAANFVEFTFVPTAEAPDHDTSRYLETMRHYYPFKTDVRHQVKLWRRQPQIDLAESGGHHVRFPGIRIYPVDFRMRHYLLLSRGHARRKYVDRVYNAQEVARGWHGARARLRVEDVVFPGAAALREYTSDATLDPSSPERQHLVFGHT